MHVDIGDVVRRALTTHRWMGQGVIQEQHPLLGVAIPASGVVLVGGIEVSIGHQSG
jgi:hypothetical protein